MSLFLLLVAGHYIADFAMQSAWVASVKGDVFRKGGDPHAAHALTAHAVHHGAMSAIALAIVGAPLWLAIFIAATHWLIDLGKARFGLFDIHVDQALHVSLLAGVAIGCAL